ncbi:hypothetical protein BABINDRAFT_159707 [Babjeviella inositovora NRRL Y-12698]|uniref:Zn(2)-C6 fungal-type domain-containing protein n=1 Tax=Babjeviella inositovora NRRL Y-12698 TaxID=984486 RepID=A0A1E3QUS9_9ASCO|nr:uncharacterized protein BABINDRAFT_159707 [Babjeviella inositovora NRRL Y-12698]ODQ81408.1 hypothetical protein BABINDRAFT_159707 [Babjeviella inositovora NRRL Y-12698]
MPSPGPIPDETPPDNAPESEFSLHWRQSRACGRCRRLKMRCAYTDPSQRSCARCSRAKIECSLMDVAESLRSKRPKPNRGTALVKDASSALANLRGFLLENTDGETGTDLAVFKAELELIRGMVPESRREISTELEPTSPKAKLTTQLGGSQLSSPTEETSFSPLSLASARSRHHRFLAHFLPSWPCITLPYTFDFLFHSRPALLLTIITVTTLDEPTLHAMLSARLESHLARQLTVSGDASLETIQCYVLLSLWCPPPAKWGSYKHQLNLLLGYTLSLCLDLGHERIIGNSRAAAIPKESLRVYLAIYASCGSLGLSLPRFSVVRWSASHAEAVEILARGDPEDEFLCLFARLVAVGQEMMESVQEEYAPFRRVFHENEEEEQSLEPIEQTRKLSDGENPDRGPLFGERSDQETNGSFGSPGNRLSRDANEFEQANKSKAFASADRPIENGFGTSFGGSTQALYEHRLYTLIHSSTLFQTNLPLCHLLSIIYYQLLMSMYDSAVCRTHDRAAPGYSELLAKLIQAGEKVIDSFVQACESSGNIPTFFFYRPMHALVALIRARLLVFSESADIEVNVEREFERVSESMTRLGKSSLVARCMTTMLGKIERWMRVSSDFITRECTSSTSLSALLEDLGRERAIADLRGPRKRPGTNTNEPKRSTTNGPDVDTDMATSLLNNVMNESLPNNIEPQSEGRKDEMTSPNRGVETVEDPELASAHVDGSYLGYVSDDWQLFKEIFGEIDLDFSEYLNQSWTPEFESMV